MNTPWKCQNCWAENQAYAATCSYCGKSVEETRKRNVADERKRKSFAFLLKLGLLIFLFIGLPAAGYGVWHWHRKQSQAAAADYEERLKNDLLLDVNGAKAQCEIEYEIRRRSSSRYYCKFVVNTKQYSSSGHPPLGYKIQLKMGEGGVVGIAPGNMVWVTYDPQNPSVNRMENDRLVDEAIDGPEVLEGVAIVFVVLLVGLSTISGWWAWRRQKRHAAMNYGQD